MMQQINKPYEGLFITIEGGEGSGKSTLSDHLALFLQNKGYAVLKTREPGGTPLCEHLRNLLLNSHEPMHEKTELLLFLAARVQHLEEQIKPALHEGQIVICERFHDSTIAYQGCARGLGMDYVEKLCKMICDNPDCTILLDNDPQEGMMRMKSEGKQPDRIEKEMLQFHREVRQGFLRLADEHPNRIAVIDAALPIEEVARQAIHALEPHLMIRKR